MATIFASYTDTTAYAIEQTSWEDARDHAGGGIVHHSTTRYNRGISVNLEEGKGGTWLYAVYRSFFKFDTSGISGTVSAATIKIHGWTSYGSPDVIAVKSNAFTGGGGTIQASDFNNIVGFTTGASLNGNATDYSAAIESGNWDASDFNDFTSTASLRTDMQNENEVIICLMNYTFDYLNQEPEAGEPQAYQAGCYFQNYSGTSKDPYIDYTVATGYGHDVCGVASANISEVDGVATANISKVIGV